MRSKHKQPTIESIVELVTDLAEIPSPSGCEREKANYIYNLLVSYGAAPRIDKMNNVLLEIRANVDSDEFCVLAAHIDTVFSDRSISVARFDDILIAPGVGDDSANVALLLKVVERIIKGKLVPKKNLLIAFDTCEEGLGNLLGVKEIMKDYEGRVSEFVSFDLTRDSVYDKAIGSLRYKVKVKTVGGHSFFDFGHANAIAEAAKIISGIYDIDVRNLTPREENVTTYSIGTIEGGISVNSIAESCKFTLDMRSSSASALKKLSEEVSALFEKANSKNVLVKSELIGERPCMGYVNASLQNKLVMRAAEAVKNVTGAAPKMKCGSTDCSVPLSMGIPSVAFGLYAGGGAHTREEYVNIDSLKTGYLILVEFMSHYFE